MVGRCKFWWCGLFIVILVHGRALASEGDSVLIGELKKYFLDGSGFKLKANFFSVWSESENPYVIVFVSSSTKVAPPDDMRSWIMHYGKDEENARALAKKYDSKQHHIFIYRTYGTSAAELNSRFTSYSTESKCFIVLHEAIHHLAINLASESPGRKRRLPFAYEDALGDIVGDYGSIEFARVMGKVDIKRTKIQKSINEKIYRRVNWTIKKINSDSSRVADLNRQCQKNINKILKRGDLFQHDRFGHEVNNAYLLKNSYYAGKYFLLKKLLKCNR